MIKKRFIVVLDVESNHRMSKSDVADWIKAVMQNVDPTVYASVESLIKDRDEGKGCFKRKKQMGATHG